MRRYLVKALENFADVLVCWGRSAAAVRGLDGWLGEATLGGLEWLSLVLTAYSQPVVEAVESAFKAGGQLEPESVINWAGQPNTAWDTNTDDCTRPQSRTDKKRSYDCYRKQILKVNIYKYLTLDETIHKNKSTGSLLRYVLQELPKRIANIERAIVAYR